MRDLTEENLTEVVIRKLGDTDDPRLKQVMSSLIQSLHAFIREVEPTQDEWLEAIKFLTEVGQKCTDERQEFILMSDTLGASMLIDAINNRKVDDATESSVLGPYYRASAPELEYGDSINITNEGDSLEVRGLVSDQYHNPIKGAILDIWQTAPNGLYDVQDDKQPDMNLRGKILTNRDGRYFFRTVRPASYPIPTDGPVGKMLSALGWHPNRPAHIHFIVSAKGYKPITTQLFIEGDPYLDSDAVFAVKNSLVANFIRPESDSSQNTPSNSASTLQNEINYDFHLEPTPRAQS
ncbi:MAG: Hydroxyquinol 1,2-dioxygenase [Alphaproteobacteria bacterium MarineAlpha9_Bin7]|nr:MAG: Hydroxyquinol 1,2-dioxygenase [Alphaproteobacteria bacterium MarineAlpha9_Bin7]